MRRRKTNLLSKLESLEIRQLLSTIYVSATAPAAGADGASWTTAYTDLQQALGIAVSGDSIEVGQGTYKPTTGTDRTATFQLKNGVAIQGGYAGYGQTNPDARNVSSYPTILSGDIGAVGNNTDNSYHVITAYGTTGNLDLLDGVTITHGNADTYAAETDNGGGLFVRNGSLAVNNCTIQRNSAGGYGGGIYDDSASLTLTNCIFNGNSAVKNGGAIENKNVPAETLVNCTLSGNTASQGGGMDNEYSSPTLTNCTLVANTAAEGSAIYNSPGTLHIAGSSPTLANCIVWDNGNNPIANSDSSTIIISDIEGGYAGVGIINADPQFVRSPWTGPDAVFGTGDDDYGDLRLRAGSPAINFGANAAIPAGITTDLAGNARIQDGIVDLGAYEGAAAAPAPVVYYVDAHAPGGGNGLSWSSAMTGLISALNVAQNGDTIKIADGTYTPTSTTNRAISFVLKSGVAIYGGYAGYGAANPDDRDVSNYRTILSGQTRGTTSNAYNSFHVVTALAVDSSTILDGVTITQGNANNSGSSQGSGGGLYAGHSSLNIDNCTFSENTASYGGGGMYDFSSSPTLTNCTFSENTANTGFGAAFGGGILNKSSSPTVINCTFTDNSASYGGGMDNISSSPTVINCTFSGNSADSGGGISDSSSSPTLINCTFNENTARGSGGGMYNEGINSLQKLTNCTFSGNTAKQIGGAVHSNYGSSVVLTNCTISGNMANRYGGAGLEVNNRSSATLINCILWSNMATSGVSEIAIGPSGTNTVSVTYSDIQGGYAGTGNIDAEPQFVDAASGNFSIEPYSPAVDAGNNLAVPSGVLTDLAGNNRFQDVPTSAHTGSGTVPIVDMGAYEATPALAASAGGPYFALAGSSITLNGLGSSNMAGALSYSWDLNGDGSFGDAAGATPTFSSTGYSAGTRVNISLQLTDAGGHTTHSDTSVTIVPPVIYVDTSARGSGNGTSWTDAYTNLSDAMQNLVSGMTIDVAQGFYYPTSGADRTASFQLMDGVSLQGGYAGDTSGNPGARDVSLYPTVLSGDIGSPGYNRDNSYRVVIGSGTNSTAVLDGFTVTDGYAGGNSGGGISNLSGSPTIANCTISGNTGAESGGGIYNNHGSSPILTNCTISGNNASNGGGIYDGDNSSPTLTNCTISGNTARYGGGMDNSSSSPTLANCTFTGNSAVYGGGMDNRSSSSATLTNCTVSGNSASDNGGGMDNDSSSPTLTSCTIAGNSASDGGGMDNRSSSPILTNCIISGNLAKFSGGGMTIGGSSPILTNCTITGNSAAEAGGGMYIGNSSPSLTNCIVWGNSALIANEIYSDPTSSTNASYSDIQDGFTGTGNIDADPLFIDPANGNYQIEPYSPAVDAGDNAAVRSGIVTDLAGSNRFQDVPTSAHSGAGTVPIVDMGAYEAAPALAASAGGPYSVLPGQSVSLTGLGSSNLAGALSYSWDLNDDGVFGDATGSTAVFSANGYTAGTQVNVSLRVTDSGNHTIEVGSIVHILLPVLYVDANATGADNGTSWSDAFTTLTEAMQNTVAGEGQVIRVAQGTYYPTTGTDRTATFQLKDGLAIYGGYAGVQYASLGATGPDARDVSLYPTILSGDIGTRGSSTYDNSFHVVTGSGTDNTANLDGFQITSGDAYGDYPLSSGGGVFNHAGSPTLTNCTISGNTAQNGGGIYDGDDSSPTLTNCTISGNTAQYGGGMDNSGYSSPTLTNCTITENTAQYGGGMDNSGYSSPTLINCTITGNSAFSLNPRSYHSYGGGMFNIFHSSPTLTNCTITGNSATFYGGGMYNGHNSSPTLANCTISGNTASSGGGIDNTAGKYIYGGGVNSTSGSSPTLTNCTISGNTASSGGGMANYDSSPTLTNCTFSENVASGSYGEGGGLDNIGSSPTLTNCTFIGNTSGKNGGGIFDDYNSAPTLINCTFIANSASDDGGGMYSINSAPSTLINCTFTGNTATNEGGAMYSNYFSASTLTNCILWNDTASSIISEIAFGSGSTNTAVVTFSDIDGGYAGTGNINADPQFIRSPSPGADGVWGTADDDYGDLHLQFTSPCIDAGSNAAVPTGVTTDLDGNARIFDFPGAHDPGAIVDMGAYELGLNLDQVIVPAGQRLALPGGGYDFTANELTIGTGGTLDVGDDSLGVTYSPGNSQASQIAGWIASGYSAGQWNGTGIVSTNTLGQPANLTGVGYYDDGTQVKIRRSWYGDTNLDGQINADDYALILLGQQTHQTNWQSGNFNYDTKVNADDWMTFILGASYTNGQKLFDTSTAIPATRPNSLLDSPTPLL